MPTVTMEDLTVDEKVMEAFRKKLDTLPVEEFDRMSASLYLRFGKYLSTSEMCRGVYSDLMDYWYERRRDDMPQLLTNRMDVRTLGLFALKIHDNHARENDIMQRWLDDNRHKHSLEGKHLKYTGVAGSGRVVFQSTHDDFKVTDFHAGSTPVELKCVPCNWKATYKKDDLIGYVKQKAVMLTLFFRNVKAEQIPIEMLKDYRSDWPSYVAFYTLLHPSDMIRLMSEVKCRNWKEVEGKPSYQLTDEFTPLDGRGKLFDHGSRYEWGR